MIFSGSTPLQSESELWRLAQKAVREHGVDAPAVAAIRAGQALQRGELEGSHTWCIVVRRAGILLQRSIRRLN